MTIPELIYQLQMIEKQLPATVNHSDPENVQLYAAKSIVCSFIGALYGEVTIELMDHMVPFAEHQIAAFIAQQRRN